jgi:zinc/manganese transport system ATP-binding protein
MEQPVISFRAAGVRIGDRDIWSGADIDVAQSEFVAVLGPNGAGKSSLLKVVLGLLPVTTGAVSIFGAEPGHHNARIGYLPQRRTFDPSLRLRGVDVVRFGIDGDRWGFPLPKYWGRRRKLDDERVDRVIDLVGAGEYAHRPIGEVSGGEQQRLLIAQALIRSPSILLLDEPLDSLDLPNQHAVASLVRKVAKSEGTTVVMVAHDVNPILSFLDRVVYVARGTVVAGKPDDVVRSEVLSDLYQTPIEVLRTSDGRLVVVGAPDGHTHHAHA